MTKGLSKPKRAARRPSRRSAEKIHEPLPAPPAKPETADQSKPPAAIYALTQYTVKRTDKGWAHAASFGPEASRWSKAFSTADAAIDAIAAKLKAELVERHDRRCAFYKLPA